MDGQFSCNKFDYVWRNISLDSSLVDEDFDNTVGVDDDGHFEPEQEAEEFVVEIVQEDEDNNDDDTDDDDESKKDDNDDESKKDDE